MSKFKRIETGIDGLVVIEPRIFGDERGFFFEVFSKRNLLENGIDIDFVQGNHSKSKKGVLRGLHFQYRQSQGKLIRVLKGRVLDIVVDLRRDSKTFGKNFKIELSEENRRILYIPKQFAHGFLTLEDDTEIEYFCDDYYAPEFDSGIIWDDRDLNIDYNFEKYGINIDKILLSEKDQNLQTFKEFVESGVVIR